MKRITTSSGTQYIYDEAQDRIKRLGGKPLFYVDGKGPRDDVWDFLYSLNPNPLVVGESMHMTLMDGGWRISTPISKIEDVIDE